MEKQNDNLDRQLNSGLERTNGRPIRVCHLITRLIIGGAQENTVYTVWGLQERDEYDVCLASGPTTGPEGTMVPQVLAAGTRYVEFPGLVREIRPWSDLKTFLALYRFFRRERFDVVHTHSAKAGIIGRFAAWLARVPVVVHTVHGWSFGGYGSWLGNAVFEWLEYLAAHCCHRLIGVADAMGREAERRRIAPMSQFRTIYSGMDLSRFMKARPDAGLASRLGIQAEDRVVVTVARLFPLKGHEELLEALPAILERVPHAKFLWVGDGVLKSSFQARAKELCVSSRLVFAGLVQPSEVADYVVLGHVLAHLSHREGLPRAIPQGFACGIPAVAYPLDGTPEVVFPLETGCLVPMGDQAALVNAIAGYLENDERRRADGMRGRELVRERFSIARMVQDIDALYRELLS
jgi:glycosyltransferase involved in cell wall biosynthesis